MPKTSDKRITLSFDNGPHAEFTPMVLDVLARHDIRTTFFVVGQNLVANRDIARRARDEGHWIGNHTWSHSFPFREKGDADFVASEIDQTQAVIGDLAHEDKLFRPYGGAGRLDGALNAVAAKHLQQHGYTCVLWNSVPGDFRDAVGWPAAAMDQISQLESPLVVLHDIHGEAMTRLDRFISQLKYEGYSFKQDIPPDMIVIRNGEPTEALGSVLAKKI
ncbi:polysaccharide deacetylase family protein [uncultured Jannaschia sp.]|uniref:polysaccharide deacetylase family protein n=1 Tax=uncultured Jannaschia sp. TaxID=293347 RepID=UPI002629AD03|nr:polysaccharide deacetylase family protein [uncultured Jannaschia sp.]